MKGIRSRKSPDVTLDGASVAVTGGANGIGRAIAEHFARLGAYVAIGDIDGQAAQRVAAEIGDRTMGLALDVSD